MPGARDLIRAAGCTTLLVLAACSEPTGQAPDQPTPERAAELTRALLLVDTHIDVPYRLYKQAADVTNATETGDFDYPRARAGGLDALFMSIYIPADTDAAGEAYAFADQLIDSVESLAADAPDKFALATCAADVERARDAGRIAMALGMENGGPIAGSFENLAHFAGRGIRYVTLAHSRSNHISDSSYDPDERWQGLSEFGRTLIPELNRQGVMVDVSHVSDKAFWQVLELTQVPVIASHSSLRHFVPGFQRNMSDEMVTALGANGGVIQINFGSGFLTAEANAYPERARAALAEWQAGMPDATEAEQSAFMERYRAEHPYPYATVNDVLDHIDRVVELAGIDHVGIGSDYDGVGPTLPEGLKDVSQYPNLVLGMLERGYSEEDVAKVLGANLLRVWKAVEAYALEAGTPTRCAQSGA
jgi:membrane dipeptidase